MLHTPQLRSISVASLGGLPPSITATLTFLTPPETTEMAGPTFSSPLLPFHFVFSEKAYDQSVPENVMHSKACSTLRSTPLGMPESAKDGKGRGARNGRSESIGQKVQALCGGATTPLKCERDNLVLEHERQGSADRTADCQVEACQSPLPRQATLHI